jgi:hypothetical protein
MKAREPLFLRENHENYWCVEIQEATPWVLRQCRWRASCDAPASLPTYSGLWELRDMTENMTTEQGRYDTTVAGPPASAREVEIRDLMLSGQVRI